MIYRFCFLFLLYFVIAPSVQAQERLSHGIEGSLEKIGYTPVQNFFQQQEDAKQKIEMQKKEQEKDFGTSYERRLAYWKEKQDHYWKELPKEEFIINASAYTSAADECGKSDGITASGIKVQANRTLACPPTYPFGMKLYIEGMGTYTCEDRGGAIKGNKFDIYMETKTEAFAFGRRNLIAYVID
ncbi:MAG: hypothetical protein EOM19_01585 [Candidatus Moranbacteria bacterium]|nr:hypothetical protein [Candidatus Moranbacteria bacterium]